MPATVVIGTQWGDEGKGKLVDLLTQYADVVVRYDIEDIREEWEEEALRPEAGTFAPVARRCKEPEERFLRAA